MNPILVGAVLGIAAAVSCYYEIKIDCKHSRQA